MIGNLPPATPRSLGIQWDRDVMNGRVDGKEESFRALGAIRIVNDREGIGSRGGVTAEKPFAGAGPLAE
ncbi:MAG: hypothetical protein BWX86_01571 [Verrucomicrobia bacterium ADurb.Bin122]|nr:MAG: hypothetical protein BWX86_01571 [Verrucomicrobia bacterium ADurb.Bin122]